MGGGYHDRSSVVQNHKLAFAESILEWRLHLRDLMDSKIQFAWLEILCREGAAIAENEME